MRTTFYALLCVLTLTTASLAFDVGAARGVLQRDAASFPGHLGVVCEDLTSRHKWGIAAHESFEAASLIKLPVLIEVYCRAAEKRLELDERLALQASDITTFSDVLKGAKPGQRFTVRQLCDAMITWSDNTATDVLLRRISMAAVNGRLQRRGYKQTYVRSTMRGLLYANGASNVTSPADMAAMLEDIYFSRDMPAPTAAAMRTLLEHQHRRHAIPALLPKGTRVANKTGELNDALHDCGIVYGPRGPYILCMLSRGLKDKARARRALQTLSLDVYRAGKR